AIDWVPADATTYPPDPGAFDLVLLAYLHLPAGQRRAALHRAAVALAPGGTLLVIGHDTTNLSDGVGGPQDPTVLFTADDVVADLSDLPELLVERAERVRRPVVTPQGTRDAVDAVVRMRRRPAQ
ncbi:MAG: class I SAM-dependent methyltransferase, partial [Acidimicrobiales bacterium]